MSFIPNLRVDYDGSAHASSLTGSYLAENAFKPQHVDSSKPWANHQSRKFPHFVWFQFKEPKIMTKIGFSTRMGIFRQVVKKFDVIAAASFGTGCGSWRILLSVENAGFERSNQAKVWSIPAENRAPYLCIGLKIHSNTDGGVYVSVQNMVMWAKRF